MAESIRAAEERARAVARAAVRANIERLGKMGQVRLEEVLAELERSRARLVAMLAHGSEFDAARAREMLAAVEEESARLRGSLTPPMRGAFSAAAEQGDGDTVVYARTLLGRETPLSQGVSVNLIDAAASRSADLVEQVTAAGRSALNRAVRMSASGSARPADVARMIGDALAAERRPTGIFGTLAAQVERVHRTEVAAMYEQAGKSRTLQVARESPWEIREVWISMTDDRVRDRHAAMNGATIRAGERFNYGAPGDAGRGSFEEAERAGSALGIACDGPHDPILPAADAVNCRCTRGMIRGPRK